MNDEMNKEEPQDDIVLTGEDNADDPEMEEIDTQSESKIIKLQANLRTCQEEKASHLDELQRAKADFLNARKRLESEKIQEKERVTNMYVEKLLPLSDSFQMAMSNQEAWNAIDEEWRKGVESINTQLHKILASFDVSEFSPVGEIFDPNLHEAMVEVPVEKEEEENTVVTVIQNGFIRTIGDEQTVVRPARVSVGVFKNN